MSPRKARRLPGAMPRRPRGGMRRESTGGRDDGEEPVVRLGPERTEPGPDGDWVVRPVPGAAAVKTYRCPGCDQEIAPGVAHVVAWPAYAPGPEQRRHWHHPCWERRLRRRPSGRPRRR